LNIYALAETLGISDTFVQLFGIETAKPSRKVRVAVKVTAAPMLWPQ
jgi:hypothetical protein